MMCRTKMSGSRGARRRGTLATSATEPHTRGRAEAARVDDGRVPSTLGSPSAARRHRPRRYSTDRNAAAPSCRNLAQRRDNHRPRSRAGVQGQGRRGEPAVGGMRAARIDGTSRASPRSSIRRARRGGGHPRHSRDKAPCEDTVSPATGALMMSKAPRRRGRCLMLAPMARTAPRRRPVRTGDEAAARDGGQRPTCSAISTGFRAGEGRDSPRACPSTPRAGGRGSARSGVRTWCRIDDRRRRGIEARARRRRRRSIIQRAPFALVRHRVAARERDAYAQSPRCPTRSSARAHREPKRPPEPPSCRWSTGPTST